MRKSVKIPVVFQFEIQLEINRFVVLKNLKELSFFLFTPPNIISGIIGLASSR